MLKSEVQKKTRELLELMSQTGFGRMENVVVKDGCPYLTQESRLVRTVVLEKKRLSIGHRARMEILF